LDDVLNFFSIQLKEIFETVFSYIPTILFLIGFILILSGMIKKKREVGKIIGGIICIILGLFFMANPGIFSDLFNTFQGNPSTPPGWH